MLPREERRRLQEIEQRLADDDPRFARRMGQRTMAGYLRARMSLRATLAVISGILAIVCLFLGDGAAMLTSLLTGGLLMASKIVDIRLA